MQKLLRSLKTKKCTEKGDAFRIGKRKTPIRYLWRLKRGGPEQKKPRKKVGVLLKKGGEGSIQIAHGDDERKWGGSADSPLRKRRIAGGRGDIFAKTKENRGKKTTKVGENVSRGKFAAPTQEVVQRLVWLEGRGEKERG